MIPGQFSRTAEAAAGLRAWGAMTAEDHALFHDPHALRMTSRRWRWMLEDPQRRRWLTTGPLRWLRPMAGQVLARSHHAEALLQGAVQQGLNQYVLVGAGLDTFHWRRPAWAKALAVFEVDHPATQAMKQARCAAAALRGAPHWVACNFERESVADALRRSALKVQQPSVFSWLGVTHYLRPAATRATLRALAEVAAPGSQLAFDYSLPATRIPQRDWLLSAGIGLTTTLLGEPLLGGITPETLAAWAGEAGWQVVSDEAGPAFGSWPVPEVTRFARWQRAT